MEVNRSESYHKEESLWIVVGNEDKKLRIGIIYNPQESTTSKKELENIYCRINQEISESKNKEQKLLLMGDFNSKVGNIIKNNNNILSKGGRILLKLVEKQNLKIINTITKAKGTWTRVMNSEKSVIDYIIINKSDEECITKFVVDEEKNLHPID